MSTLNRKEVMLKEKGAVTGALFQARKLGKTWRVLHNVEKLTGKKRENLRKLEKIEKYYLRFLEKSLKLKSVDEHPHKQVKN